MAKQNTEENKKRHPVRMSLEDFNKAAAESKTLAGGNVAGFLKSLSETKTTSRP